MKKRLLGGTLFFVVMHGTCWGAAPPEKLKRHSGQARMSRRHSVGSGAWQFWIERDNEESSGTLCFIRLSDEELEDVSTSGGSLLKGAPHETGALPTYLHSKKVVVAGLLAVGLGALVISYLLFQEDEMDEVDEMLTNIFLGKEPDE